jgi:hypothetical protein
MSVTLMETNPPRDNLNDTMTTWLYAASRSWASERETFALASESGFIWRSFYNKAGSAIACARDIEPGDDLRPRPLSHLRRSSFHRARPPYETASTLESTSAAGRKKASTSASRNGPMVC